MSMSRAIARSLMRLVPADTKGTATITLNTLYGTKEVVTVPGCWLKPTKGGMQNHGGILIENEQTILKVPDLGLNPAANGREIKQDDEIVLFGATYVVTDAGGNLTTVRTVWDCNVQAKG